MDTKGWLFLSLLIFSLFSFHCCQDRLFDNPFDPQAGKIFLEVVNTIYTPAIIPQGLCWDGNTLWNVDSYTNTLYSLNRLNGSQVRALTSPLPATTGIAYDGQDLWVCSDTSVDVYKINLLNGDVQKRIHLQRGSFMAVVYGQGFLWLAETLSNEILKVDPETAELVSSFANPGTLVGGMAFDGTDLWLSDPSSLTIYQVSTEGMIVRTYLSPGQSPQGLAHDGSYLWNADGDQRIFQLRVQD